MIVDTWEHCYGASYKGDIVGPAFAHPAKASKALIFKIIAHAVAEEWLHAGSTVCDPFCGIATTALPCLLQGINFVGCELEERFVGWAQENLAYWHQRHGHRMQGARGIVVQGDSRSLGKVLAQADAIVSSPPYADGCIADTGQDPVKVRERAGTRYPWGTRAEGDSLTSYSHNPANLGNLKAGEIGAILASPPYVNADTKPAQLGSGKATRADGDSAGRNKGDYHYPDSPGQLGVMPAGDVRAIIASPPYGESDQNYANGWRYIDRSRGIETRTNRTGRQISAAYGKPDGQLGQTNGDTFWSASLQIVRQSYALLKPGGIAIWIVKSYVRDKQIVDFPGDWRALCEHAGFEALHEHHATLVDTFGMETSLWGEDQAKTRKHAGFFRTLQERKGSPPINDEIVYCMRRP